LTQQQKGVIRVVATGSAWIGNGVGSVESAIEKMLNDAKNRIQIAAYQISDAGVAFLQPVENCLAKGIKVTLIVNHFNDHSSFVKNKLMALLSEYSSLTCINFNPASDKENLHAKVIVVDDNWAFVGSSNLSWHGMVTNHELGVIIRGPAARTISNLLDNLACDSSCSIIYRN
jgi:phosphatidylserine/phosphatidylglycerophosphate/cardiolipin synthase-like enzyme